MRLSHLFVDLIGLAGLAIVSPTPIDIRGNAGVDARASSPKRLVVFAQDYFQGLAYEIDAANRCVKFKPPVYKSLHSYHVVDMVCYFMDTDRCNGKVLVTTAARGTEIWGRIDVGGVGDHEGRITSVYCGDRQLAITAQADAAPTKRDKHTNLSALVGPGETIVCENTLESGHCETLSANGACVSIPAGIAHNIRSIYQAAGSICKYYDSTCDAATPVLTLNSHRQPSFLPLDKSVGNRIGLVMCRDQWLTVEPKDGSAPIEARNTGITAGYPGDVRARTEWAD